LLWHELLQVRVEGLPDLPIDTMQAQPGLF
jgi:hypothetical protein